MVGPVNCTTYIHGPTGAIVELGHGSGGGFTFKSSSESPARCEIASPQRTTKNRRTWISTFVASLMTCSPYPSPPSSLSLLTSSRWVWDDGRVEEESGDKGKDSPPGPKLACPAVEKLLREGKGKLGKPKSLMFNRSVPKETAESCDRGCNPSRHLRQPRGYTRLWHCDPPAQPSALSHSLPGTTRSFGWAM